MGVEALLAGDGWPLDAGGGPLHFEADDRRLTADRPEQLAAVLSALDDVAESGDPDLLAVGFVSYEAGVVLEGSTGLFRPPEGTPLAAFGLFRLGSARRGWPAAASGSLSFDGRPAPEPSFSLSGWTEGVEGVRAGIARGDVYQVNLTRRTRFRSAVRPLALARALHEENPVGWAVTIAAEGWAVVSNSPELFLDADLTACRAASAPIKGTIARGRTEEDDGAAKAALLASAKDAAEHVMIVDLVRNDLGRVAEPGGVRVERLGALRTYRHLHHLESLVAARLARGTRLSDLLRATLPGGSITGAPKRAALGFIRRVEPCPRGAYTGVAGFVRGDGRAVFNVAIRTAVVHGGVVDYHAGGGIVWDSEPAAEWAEVETKSREFLAVVRRGGTVSEGESDR